MCAPTNLITTIEVRPEPKKRGRPKKYNTPEEKAQGLRDNAKRNYEQNYAYRRLQIKSYQEQNADERREYEHQRYLKKKETTKSS